MNRECDASRTSRLLAGFSGVSVGILAVIVLTATPAAAAPLSYPPGTTSVVNTWEDDNDGDGVTDVRTVYTTVLDGKGVMLSTELSRDLGADGTVDQLSQTSYTYDDAGRLTLATSTSDWDGDGLVDSTTWEESTYDSRGQLIGIVTSRDVDGDGDVDTVERVAVTADKASRVTTTVAEADVDGDGTPDARTTTTVTLDTHGREVRKEVVTEDLSTGTLQSTLVETTYGPRGRVLSLTTTASGDDGTEVTRTDFSYDARGNLTEYAQSTTPSGASSLGALTYDTRGNLTASVTKTDADGDGEVDSTETSTYTYDQRSRNVSMTLSIDGEFASTLTATYEYDAGGNPISTVQSVDLGSDGSVESVTEMESTYDARGRQTRSVVTTTEDDVVVVIQTTTSEFTNQGRLLSSVSETDWGGDGTVEQRAVFTSAVS